MSKKSARRSAAKEKAYHVGRPMWRKRGLNLKARNPAGVKADAAKLEAIEAMPDTECSREYIPRLCMLKHLAAKARHAKGLEHGKCCFCLRILEANKC
jgi:hypothetical protein